MHAMISTNPEVMISESVKRASANNLTLVCEDVSTASLLSERAAVLNLSIAPPITYDEFLSSDAENVLIFDLGVFLSHVLGGNIDISILMMSTVRLNVDDR